jgi:hypothetical protein
MKSAIHPSIMAPKLIIKIWRLIVFPPFKASCPCSRVRDGLWILKDLADYDMNNMTLPCKIPVIILRVLR